MLTLPIQIGKKYVRRDGVVVKAQPHHFNFDSNSLIYVGDGIPTPSGLLHVFAETGSVGCGFDYKHDLIADAEENPAGHPHAALMMLYAQDAAETAQPWIRWQVSSGGGEWDKCTCHPAWGSHLQYRRKPLTIKISDCEIQAPERVAPAFGSPYWIPATHWMEDFSEKEQWYGDNVDFEYLLRGLVHLTQEAAEAHAKALISLTSLTAIK